jgi:hypothetical protein
MSSDIFLQFYLKSLGHLNSNASQAWWCTPTVPDTQEAEVGGSQIQGQPRQLSSKNKQKGWVFGSSDRAAKHAGGPGSIPSTGKNIKKPTMQSHWCLFFFFFFF